MAWLFIRCAGGVSSMAKRCKVRCFLCDSLWPRVWHSRLHHLVCIRGSDLLYSIMELQHWSQLCCLCFCASWDRSDGSYVCNTWSSDRHICWYDLLRCTCGLVRAAEHTLEWWCIRDCDGTELWELWLQCDSRACTGGVRHSVLDFFHIGELCIECASG